ncbi:conserved hypothetical Ustilaginaceae-specific protein [Sporisorium reilianum SRZ2]|uniref:Conserved hypothetical Ustilaginaceae-specific protein n=1 Tax=Sporisorium reilianum (strain SRZ2) TaxID=999809 RepID=E6ZTT4_SPORE|nr:conserved hypothetical Ustilaginaceae-specific protein [Sporisorium reilianum SRZ2]
MICTGIRQTVVSTLFVIALFLTAAVIGRPTPPVPATEVLEAVLSHLGGSPDAEPERVLQQQALHNPFRPPIAFRPHSAQVNPLLYGFHYPNPPPYLNYRWMAPGFGHHSVSADSPLVSRVPPEAQLLQDTNPSPHVPLLDGVPFGYQIGPPPYGGAYHVFTNPTLQHQTPSVPLRGELSPAFPATPPQINHAVAPETAAGPSRPPEDVGTSASTRLKTPNKITYQTVYQPDPSVDDFIAMLRSRIAHEGLEAVHEVRATRPVELPTHLDGGVNSLAVNTFRRRNLAKEVIMSGQSGVKRLLITYYYKPRFLPRSASKDYIGVWAIGPAKVGSNSDLFLHGFYPFTSKQYGELGRQPEAVGEYYLTMRHRFSGLSITVDPVSSSERGEVAVLPQEAGDPAHATPSQGHILAMGQDEGEPILYRAYVYQEDPAIVPLLEDWCNRIHMRADAFTQVHLSREEQLLLPVRIGVAFHFPRQVKIVTTRDGTSLMLAFHGDLSWMKQHKGSVMTVWRFGRPELTDDGTLGRTMYAVGVFRLSKRTWLKLQPEDIPGLRDSIFPNDRVDYA